MVIRLLSILVKSKQWDPYTTDNKNEPFQHGDLKGTGYTPRDLMTTDPDKLPPPYNNPKFREGLLNTNKEGMFYYTPIAREWMAEAASRGRQLLGSSASLKNNIQGAHSMLSSMPGEEQEGHAIIPVFFKPSGVGGPATKFMLGVRFKEKAKTDEESTSLYRDLSRTSIALPSDPMDEIGMKRKDKFFELLYDSIFDMEVASFDIIDPRMKVFGFNKGDNIKISTIHSRDARHADKRLLVEAVLGQGQQKWGAMAFEPANKKLNRIKSQGILKLFTDANSAYYGKNWSESRRHSMAERRRLAAGLAEAEPEHGNTHLAKVARVLARNKYYDSIIARIDMGKLKGVYDEYRKALEDYEVLQKTLNRRTMAVEWKSNPYFERVIANELWLPENQDRFAESYPLFQNLFKGTPATKRYFLMANTGDQKNFEYTTKHASRALDGRDAVEWRREIIDQTVEAANDMIIQDMWDMISVRNMKNAMDEGRITPERAAEIFTKADKIRAASKKLKDEKTRNELDGDSVDDALFGMEKESAAITQLKVDEMVKVQKDTLDEGVINKKQKYETKLFESFLTGSIHRGELGRLEADYNERLRTNTVTPKYQEWYDKEKLGTASTGMSTFAMKSQAISDATIKDYLTEFNKLFNKSSDVISEAERKRLDSELERSEESQKIDGIEVNALEDPFQGIRGLQEAAASKKLDKEGQELN